MNAMNEKRNGKLTQRAIVFRMAARVKNGTQPEVHNKKYVARRMGTDVVHAEKTIRYLSTYRGLRVEVEANNFVFVGA